jgi:Helix-turn-helix.
MQPKIKVKLFPDRIRVLRETKQLLQRQLASALEIDTPMYSKIERGERPAKREQVIIIAKLLNIDEQELLSLWLADKINDTINDEPMALKAIEIVKEHLKTK